MNYFAGGGPFNKNLSLTLSKQINWMITLGLQVFPVEQYNKLHWCLWTKLLSVESARDYWMYFY